MLSVQSPESAAAAPGNHERRPDHFANDLTLFKQPRLGVSLDGLLDEIRYRKDLADFEQNKSGIASIILLAHNMGLVSEQEIDRCVTDGWRDIYFLYRSSIKSIVEYLGNESGNIAGEKARHDSYETLWVSLAKESDGAYIYLSAGMRYSQFYLLDLNDELRRVIYSCFNWIVNVLGFGILANDFVGASMMIAEEMDDYQIYRNKNPELNKEELASLILDEDHDTIFSEFTTEPGYLVERFEFLDLILANSVESQFGTVMSMDEIRAAVIRWRWSEPETFSSSWVGFINQTIRAWKWFRRCTLFDQSKIMEGCEYGGGAGVSLHYAHFVGLGLPWEDAVVDDAAQNVYEAGDVPIAKLNIKPVAIPQVAEKLMMLAKARGLLRLAEITNFGEDSE